MRRRDKRVMCWHSHLTLNPSSFQCRLSRSLIRQALRQILCLWLLFISSHFTINASNSPVSFGPVPCLPAVLLPPPGPLLIGRARSRLPRAWADIALACFCPLQGLCPVHCGCCVDQ